MGSFSLPNQITREQFEKAIKLLYDAIPDSTSTTSSALLDNPLQPLKQRLLDAEDPLQDVANDVRSTGILVFDQSKSGSLRFSHKSFMEFLIARVYAQHSFLSKNREESAAIMASTHLGSMHIRALPLSRSFLVELLAPELRDGNARDARLALTRSLFNLIAIGSYKRSAFARVRGMGSSPPGYSYRRFPL